MVSEGQGVGGSGQKRSRAEALRIAAEYEASGTSGAAFSARHGLGLSTLVRYRKWYRESRAENKGRWLAVEVSEPKPEPVSSTESKLSVLLSHGRRIEVQHGFDAVTLKQLLHVLESA
jgi:transposase-like protein